LRTEQLRQANNLRALVRRILDAQLRPLQILLRVRRTRHLYQADGEFSLHPDERTQVRVICQEAVRAAIVNSEL